MLGVVKQFKDGMLTMMTITSSALELSELNISRLYDVLREEEYVILERFALRIAT